MSHVNEFFRNKITKHSMQKTNREWGQWTFGHVPVSQTQLSVDGASKVGIYTILVQMRKFIGMEEILPCSLGETGQRCVDLVSSGADLGNGWSNSRQLLLSHDQVEVQLSHNCGSAAR
ncbi:unnamed protein product [Camellia sinensis]